MLLVEVEFRGEVMLVGVMADVSFNGRTRAATASAELLDTEVPF